MKPPLRRLGWAGSLALGVLVVIAIVAVATALGWVGRDHRAFTGEPFESPSAVHWLGTDALGRDVAARAAQGAVVSTVVGVSAATGLLLIGTLLGATAGLRGAGIDRVLVTLGNAVAAIPSIVAMLGIGVVLRPGLFTIVIAIVATQWVGTFRAIRSETQRIRSADFYRAATAMGAGPFHQIVHHVVPNLVPLLFTMFAIQLVHAVQAEAVLAYFGLGSQSRPSWGRMLAEGANELARGHPWPAVAAAGSLTIMVLSVQIVTDRLARHD